MSYKLLEVHTASCTDVIEWRVMISYEVIMPFPWVCGRIERELDWVLYRFKYTP